MQKNFENLYVSGKRIGTTNCKFNENKERDLFFVEREKEAFLWSFLRFSYSSNQFIPSWTGYNIAVIDGTPVYFFFVCFALFFKLGFTPCKAEQLLQAMELQEKET